MKPPKANFPMPSGIPIPLAYCAYVEYVEINPEVMGGQPVIRDTRVPTSILATLREQGKSIAELVRLYQPVSRKLIVKALEYEALRGSVP